MKPIPMTFVDRRKQRKPVQKFNGAAPDCLYTESDVQARNDGIDDDAVEAGRMRRAIEVIADQRALNNLTKDPWE